MPHENPSILRLVSPHSDRDDEVCPAAECFELPDLRVAEGDALRMRRALVAAHLELALPPAGVAVHAGLLARLLDCLEGREPLVWQEDDRVKVSFGAFSHEERDQVENLAERLADTLGAAIVFATTNGMVASADADFLT